MKSKVKDILEWVYCIIIAIVIAILIKTFIGVPTVVQQRSMYPTLVQGDRLILNKIPKVQKKMPKRGDIITFEAPSKTAYKIGEADMSNPVAKYNYEPKGLFQKFVYNILEINKVSYIKRVIALPGEHLVINEGKVYINGEELKEDYLNDGVTTIINGEFYDLVVPENTVFAMGDNRAESVDCRSFGCIPLEKIESKVWIRFWPFNKFGKVK